MPELLSEERSGQLQRRFISSFPRHNFPGSEKLPKGIMARLDEQRTRKNHIAQLKRQLVLTFEKIHESEEKGRHGAAQSYKLNIAEITRALLNEGAIK